MVVKVGIGVDVISEDRGSTGVEVSACTGLDADDIIFITS